MQPYFLTFILIIVATLLVKAKHIGVPKELGIPYAREEK
jgi:simple sugar transport system permease protein